MHFLVGVGSLSTLSIAVLLVFGDGGPRCIKYNII